MESTGNHPLHTSFIESKHLSQDNNSTHERSKRLCNLYTLYHLKDSVRNQPLLPKCKKGRKWNLTKREESKYKGRKKHIHFIASGILFSYVHFIEKTHFTRSKNAELELLEMFCSSVHSQVIWGKKNLTIVRSILQGEEWRL